MQKWKTLALSYVVKGGNDEMEKVNFMKAFLMSILKMKAHFAKNKDNSKNIWKETFQRVAST